MATEKQELIKTAQDLGIELKGNESAAIIRELIDGHVPDGGNNNISNQDDSNDDLPIKQPVVEPQPERMVKYSDVQALIAEEMAKFREQDQAEKGVKKVKRVMEHQVQIHRWNAKWVINFVNKNNDPYLKDPIFAYDVWSEQKRQNIAHLDLVLWDEKTGEETTETVTLTRYIERRASIYCLIVKRHKIDASYSIGEIEVKKDKGDGMMKGTGVYRDQEVIMDKELFEVKLPTGEMIKVPDYAVC